MRMFQHVVVKSWSNHEECVVSCNVVAGAVQDCFVETKQML